MRINSVNKSMDMEARDINYILPAFVRSYLFYSKNEMPEKIIFPMFASVNVLGVDGQTHPIPIEWVSEISPIAEDIKVDGSEVTEVTTEQEAVIDEKEDETTALKAEIAELTKPDESITTQAPEDIIRQQEETIQQLEDDTADKQLEVDTTPATESPAKAAFAEHAGESVQKVEKERYEEHGKKMEKMVETIRVPKQPPGGDIGPGLSVSESHPRDNRDQGRTARDLRDEPETSEAEEKPFDKEISRGEDGKPVVEGGKDGETKQETGNS